MKAKLFVLAVSVALSGASLVYAGDSKDPAMQCCPMDPKAAAALDKMKALTGTWTAKPAKEGEPPMSVVFRPTSGGTAVMESMFPGTKEEMVNLFTASGDTIQMTHFCAMGNQPRMKMSPSSDGKTMKFEFVDGGNIQSRNDPHMDSVEMTVDGDKLTEDWSFYNDGKVVDHKVFEFTRSK
jgi:hypothetical protein